MKLADLSVAAYIEKTADTSSLPGGGSVAALNASLAASLGMMILRLSGKEVDPLWQNIAADARENIDADGHAFDDVLAAFRLPKETPEQAAVRREAVENGYIRAIEVPLSTMACAEKTLRLLDEVKERIDKHAVSDLYIAADLAITAFRGAGYTAKLNIDALRDETRRQRYAEQVAQSARRVTALHAAILASAPAWEA